jgi:type II secretory pathway component GspD/PulD (secretin)
MNMFEIKLDRRFFLLLIVSLSINAANNIVPGAVQSSTGANPAVIKTPAGTISVTPPPAPPSKSVMPVPPPPPPATHASAILGTAPLPPVTSVSTSPAMMPSSNPMPAGVHADVNQGPFSGDKIISKTVLVNQAHADPAFRGKIEQVWKNKSSYNNPKAHLSIDASSVVIRGVEQDVIDLENYIVSLDKPVVQVRVDAIILFAQRNYNFDIGIDWSGIYNRAQSIAANSNPFGFVGLGGTLNDIPKPTAAYNSLFQPAVGVAQTSPTVDTNLFVNPNNFALNLFNKVFTPTTALSAGNSFVQIPFVFGGADLNLRRLNLVLNAAESESKVKIVSRPSVLTGSAQVATVNIGQQLPMQQSSINQGTGTIYKSGQVVYKSVGISLTVTPTVGSDNKTITLNIKISDIEVVSGSTQSNNDGIMTNPPLLSDLSVTNTVVLKSGQTTVIGGLATRSDRKTTNRVPLLYRIPFVGNLFQASLSSDAEMEQFIFLTPTIIEENVF